MRSSQIRRPSPAMVVALLAPFASVGGTSYAVKKIGSRDIADGSIRSIDIGNGQVRSSDIGNGQVRSSNIRDRSLRSEDFARGELPPAGAGAEGTAGTAGSHARAFDTPAAEQAIGRQRR